MKTSKIILLAVAAGLAAGCKGPKETITTSPAPYVVVADSANRLNMDLTLTVPAHYFSTRSRLIVTPQLMVGDSAVRNYEPMVLDAPIFTKKKLREAVLHGAVDPLSLRSRKVLNPGSGFDIGYRESLELPDSTGEGMQWLRALVSADGCGTCSAIDTVPLAAVSYPEAVIDIPRSAELVMIVPEFRVEPKIAQGGGVCHLQFIINKYDIVPELGNNEAELRQMLDSLRPIVGDTLATMTSLDIYGMASADGSYAFNTTLSRNRANSARRWLVDQLGLSKTVQDIISVGSRPEGWQPVVEAMEADNHPGVQDIRDILWKTRDAANDDTAERLIRRSRWWGDIRDRYLQKDRKVEYSYTYVIRSFTTEAELIGMYEKRPDAFNEQEFLRVAQLAADKPSQIEVYRTMLRYFPQNETALNNLATLYLETGDPDAARELLDGAREYSPRLLATQAAAYAYANDFERAVELLSQTPDDPSARYNLGLIRAKQRKFAEAWELLEPFADANAAVVALSLGKTDEAAAIMDARPDAAEPLDAYVRALITSRRGDRNAFFANLRALVGDPQLRGRAADEPEFRRWALEPEFDLIIKEGAE